MRLRDLLTRPSFKVVKAAVSHERALHQSKRRSWHGYGLAWGKPGKGGGA